MKETPTLAMLRHFFSKRMFYFCQLLSHLVLNVHLLRNIHSELHEFIPTLRQPTGLYGNCQFVFPFMKYRLEEDVFGPKIRNRVLTGNTRFEIPSFRKYNF